jgi:hypothetical protein
MKQLLYALIVGGLAACSSTGSDDGDEAPAEKGTPILLSFVDYRTGARSELVNESHTSKLEQYSKPRSDAARKVQSDELVAGLVEYLEDNGFRKLAASGDPPYLTGGQFYWTLQLVEPERRCYVAAGRNTSLADKQRLHAFSQAFLGVYNHTDGWQAVEVKPGEMPFKGPNLKPGGGR